MKKKTKPQPKKAKAKISAEEYVRIQNNFLSHFKRKVLEYKEYIDDIFVEMDTTKILLQTEVSFEPKLDLTNQLIDISIELTNGDAHEVIEKRLSISVEHVLNRYLHAINHSTNVYSKKELAFILGNLKRNVESFTYYLKEITYSYEVLSKYHPEISEEIEDKKDDKKRRIVQGFKEK